MKEIETFGSLKEKNPMFSEIIKIMFEHIGLEITDDYVFEHFWFTKHSWSEEQENSFKVKVLEYLNNQKLRDVRVMSNNCSITKKKFKKIADEIAWNWGWKTERSSAKKIDDNDI